MSCPPVDPYAEYKRLLHAMQSGVACYESDPGGDQTPKHLRVGINAAMSDHGALVALLIEKGVFTEAEYIVKLEEFMRREVRAYEMRLTDKLGKPVKLL